MSRVDNQSVNIRRHLVEKGSITSMEAFKLYGCTRLASRICQLRQKGWDIDTVEMESTTRYGDFCRYAKYVFKSKPEK